MGFIGWPLGLLLSFLSSIFGILGKLSWKLAHNELERIDKERTEEQKDDIKTTNTTTTFSKWHFYFYVGAISMLVLNPSLGALSYTFASQSLLAPMAGMTIGWNTLMGPILLPHENLTTHDLIGAFLIFTGCVLVGVFGPHATPVMPVATLSKRFTSLPFLIYSLIFLAVFLYLLRQSLAALHFLWSSRRPRPTTLQPPDRKQDITPFTRVSLSILAGITSGQLYFLAASMQLIHQGHVIWYYPATYACAAGAIGTALGGLYLLHAALFVEEAVVVIYLYEASYIISGALSGLCFSQEMHTLGLGHALLYVLSLILILIGIYIVARRHTGFLSMEGDEEILLLPLLDEAVLSKARRMSNRSMLSQSYGSGEDEKVVKM